MAPIFRSLWVLWLGLAFGPVVAVAQSEGLPFLNIEDRPFVLEGDHSSNFAKVHWNLTHASDTEIRFTAATEDGFPVTAIAGVDYVPLPPTQVIVPPGVTEGDFKIEVLPDLLVEEDEKLRLHFSNFVGTLEGDGMFSVDVTIFSNDGVPRPVLMGHDDHVAFAMNAPAVRVDPDLNDADVTQPDILRDAMLTLTSLPQHGAVSQRRHQYMHATDYFVYVPDVDFAGRDEFGYRLCYFEGQCVEAKVVMEGGLGPYIPVTFGSQGRLGRQAWQLTNLPALANARYRASTLAAPSRPALATGVDDTPELAWDSPAGMDWETYVIPATAAGKPPAEYRVYVRSKEAYDAKIDILVGVDANGDGAPSAGEQGCFAGSAKAWNLAFLSCEIAITVGSQPVTYWVAAHSREATPRTPKLEVFEARMDADEDTLVVTGPTMAERYERVDVLALYRDPTIADNDPRVGYVRIVDEGRVVGEARFEHAGSSVGYLILPLDGTPLTFVKEGTTDIVYEEQQIFFDVPAGTSSVTLTATSDIPVDFQLVYLGFTDPHYYTLRTAPPGAAASWVATVPGQYRSTTVTQPWMGRWYAVVRNRGSQRARVQLSASVQGNYAAIRSGSYYNQYLPGHGLLLYPAGEQWAGLWYTYNYLGRPTWYYLQAPKPGPNGIWHSPVYRSSWDGANSRLALAGEMTVTPISTGQDRFLMSYTIDGLPGSQQMGPLGRGCPRLNGAPVDISSHWFDPARSGTGYSVQMWDDYEFFAAFMYDQHGEPVFFVAEAPQFGGEVADLPLEILGGACISCGSSGSTGPRRTPAGVLRRILQAGSLAEIQLNVDYPELEPLSGQRTWTVTDQVQMLGGPGTTQGCDP